MRRLANGDAGIVDENVDAAEFAPDALDHGRHRSLVGDVGDDGDRLDAVLPKLGHGIVRLRLIARDDRNRGAGLGKPARHAKTDPAIAAGDDRDLAAEIE